MKIKEIYSYENERYKILRNPMRKVMEKYQNAAKWFDTIQEELLMEKGLNQIPQLLHNMAHDFPKEFDSFSEILHQKNLKVEYPATEELVLSDEDLKLSNVFKNTTDFIQTINNSLSEMIEICEESEELKPFVDQLSSLREKNLKKIKKIFTIWRMFDTMITGNSFEESIYASLDNWVEENIEV